MNSKKPLGGKAYGSIPHLPTSRLGPGEHHIHEGQQRICLETARDRHDQIIVTEKLDGSCVSIANVDGSIIALSRAGYRAETTPYEQHHIFASWVSDRLELFSKLLLPGMRLVGEWLALAHGTRYELWHEPFVLFDVMVDKKRLSHDVIARTGKEMALPVAHCLWRGSPLSLQRAKKLLKLHSMVRLTL